MDRNASRRRSGGRVALLLGALLALAALLAPAHAGAQRIANPSPPDFYGEVTGGFLQLSGGGGTKILQLPLDFEELGVQKPSFRGTINSAGAITIPRAQFVFPPLPLDDVAPGINVSLLPTHDVTGSINPLTGAVDFRIRIKIQISGSYEGISLGSSCFVASDSNPIDIDTKTIGTNGQPLVASFLSDNAGFAGGNMAAEPYTDEPGLWLDGPTPSGTVPPEDMPQLVSRSEGSWRGVNETLQAGTASGCGPLGAGNGQVNDLVGLPSDPNGSTAVLDFRFIPGGSRTGTNAIVQKGVKADFTSPGLSTPDWPSTEVPELPTTVTRTIDASGSIFRAAPNPAGRYSFDLGTGTFGGYTDTAVQPISFSTPGLRTIRVKARDADGDEDTQTRQILVVPSTDIGVAATAVNGSVRAGSDGVIKVDVTNASAERTNTQPINVTIPVPAGTTYQSTDAPAGWSCSEAGGSVTCTLPTGELAGSETDSIRVNVGVAPTAAGPLTGTVSVSQAGDTNGANDSAPLSVPVRKTDLSLDLSHQGDVVANGTVAFAVDVDNLGDGETVGETTVALTLPPLVSFRPAGTSGAGWSCSADPTPQDVTCVYSDVIPGNGSASPLTVMARADRTSSGNVAAGATVSTQADTDAFGGANSDSDPFEILVRPDLALETEVSGDFTVGDPGALTMTAANESVLDIGGPTTIASQLPAGLTVTSVSGTGWDCSATTPGASEISCTYADGVLAGESAPGLVAQLAVGHGAYPGTSIPVELDNAADGFAGNDATTTAATVHRLDLAINKSAVRSFSVGIEGQYRLSVTNVGDAETVGPIEVLDELPPELVLRGASGGGWDCSASVVGQQHVECVRTAPIVAGTGAPVITVRVDVLDAAAEAGEVSNTATVDTERDDRAVEADGPVNGNNSSTAVTKAVSVDLSVESTHGGTFRVGSVDTYSIKVRNVGAFPTVAGQPITVVDTLPAGMVPQVEDIWTDRPGWQCSAEESVVTCVQPAPDESTSAMLAGQTATIDIPVLVTSEAAEESVNTVQVATEKDTNAELSPNNVDEDPTSVRRIDLALTASQSLAPRAGGIGEISAGVTNHGTAATVNPTVVTVPLQTGVSYRPTGSTVAGWSCSSPGAGTQIACTYTASIGAGQSATPLKLRTNVSAAAPDQWTTEVIARTDGEVDELLEDNDVEVEQDLEKIDLAVTKSHAPDGVKAGTRSEYLITVANVGNTASTGTTTVTEQIDPTFTAAQASGEGWSCGVAGQALTCTRVASIPGGGAAPAIRVSFDVPVDAAGTRNSTAHLANASDPYGGNDSDDDPITIVASADVRVTSTQPSGARVGDVVPVTYHVQNVGTDATSGSPGVRLRVTLSENLEPVDTIESSGWDCEQAPSTGSENGYFDCALDGELAPGQIRNLTARVRAVSDQADETGTFGRAVAPGDVNLSNNSALTLWSLSGIDLETTVAEPAEAEMRAGEASRRLVGVENVGSSPTTAPVTVTMALPAGVSWVDAGIYGSGWSCSLVGDAVKCSRTDVLAAGQSYPAITVDLRPSRSNAPGFEMGYTVQTLGDSNDANDTAIRSEVVLFQPETTITKAPTGTTTSRSATVEFESDDEDATFECQVDGAAYAPCTSPLEMSGLGLGGHGVNVRAVNEHDMVDATPAEAVWTVVDNPPSGDKVPLRATLTEGELSLASLGEVPLPAGQLVMDGELYENGGWAVPQAGVDFKPVEQQVDVEGIGSVTVKISIQATGPGTGTLPNGGGDATFNLPVQAKVEASLGSLVVIGPEADCYVRPVQFSLAGTYDEAARTTSISSPNVSFPTVSSGCGPLGAQVNEALELPRSDIGISLEFGLEKGAAACPPGKLGAPPNCQDPAQPVLTAKLGKPVIKAPKKARSGKRVTVTAKVRNGGDGPASGVKVCLRTPKKLVRGKASRCKRVAEIAAGATATVRFKVRTKKGKAGRKARMSVSASYAPTAGQPIVKTTRALRLSLVK